MLSTIGGGQDVCEEKTVHVQGSLVKIFGMPLVPGLDFVKMAKSEEINDKSCYFGKL